MAAVSRLPPEPAVTSFFRRQPAAPLSLASCRRHLRLEAADPRSEVGDKGRRAKPSPAFSLGSIGRACIFYSALVCSKGRRFGKGRGWFDYIAGWTRLQSRPPTGIGGVHGRSKALKGVVVCSNKRARQPFGNDRLFSLLGFGNGTGLTAWAVFSSHAGAGWCVGVWPRPSRPCDS